jgi:[CysO sulfur-carrier protein]-S-L-cysteine hydrolase
VSIPFRLVLPTQIRDEMFVQAQTELPNECCGLLAGRVADGIGQVVKRYPLKNTAASPVEYLSDPADMFAAERDMRRQGLEVLAVYHSHPTSEALPSRTDRERNYSTQIVNLIISLKGGTPVMRGWWLTEDSSAEADWEIN